MKGLLKIMTASLLFLYPRELVFGRGKGMEGEGKYVMLLLKAKNRREWEDEKGREREQGSLGDQIWKMK